MGLVNEKIVLNYYIEQMKEDKISFLKNKNYFKEKIEKEIINLRDEDDIHEKIQYAKELWKVLFEAAMTYIDSDKRGYDKLFKYFDEYVNFEELIFASDSFYRDHTLHSLWVYFLGEYLMCYDELKFNEMYEMNNYISLFIQDLEELKMDEVFEEFIMKMKNMLITYELSESVRCISALTHDLGYPLKKVNKINKCIKNILPYFGINSYEEFNFKYNEVQQSYIQNFIEVLNSPIAFTTLESETKNEEELLGKFFILNGDRFIDLKVKKEAFKEIDDKEKESLRKLFKVRSWIAKNTETYLRYSNDFENYNHGIMSAFLLVKTIKAFEKMRLKYSDNSNLQDWGYNYKDYMSKYEILTSITDHTSEGRQITSLYGSHEYLMLIDELEEFSRISRANKNRQFINEFCKTEISINEGIIEANFIFDNVTIDNLDPERAFKDKCKKFLNTFDIKNLDEKLKIRISFIGKLSYDDNIYILEIGRKYANIMINGIEQDIPRYLKSNQFYTKEGYMKL